MRLVRELRRQVLLGRLGEGAPLPSIRELIEEKGIGQSAVRQALKRVEQEGWARRRAEGGKLWVIPGAVEAAKAHFAAEPPPTIFMLTSLDRRFGGDDQIRELEQGFGKAFGTCEIRQVGVDTAAGPERVARLLQENSTLPYEAGYLLAGLPSEIKLLFHLNRVPCVVLGSVDPEINLPCVTEDMREVGCVAGRLLCRKGRAVVLFCNSPVGSEADLISGVRQAIKESTRQYPSWDDCAVSLSGSPREYESQIDQLLTRADRPAGILAVQPPLAMAVLKVASRRGIRIPHELQLVGYHHSSAYIHVHPEITSVGVKSVKTLGQQAGSLLAEAMTRPRRVAPREVVEYSLIERESTLPSP